MSVVQTLYSLLYHGNGLLTYSNKEHIILLRSLIQPKIKVKARVALTLHIFQAHD